MGIHNMAGKRRASIDVPKPKKKSAKKTKPPIADPWRLAVKARLRSVVTQTGSQRLLAKQWLGNPEKSGEVSIYCNDTETQLPSAETLQALKTRCSVSLDWLLGPVEPEANEADKDWYKSWSPERHARLLAEVNDYCSLFVHKRIREGDLRRGYSPHRSGSGGNQLVTPYFAVLSAVKFNFLAELESELCKLTDLCVDNSLLEHYYGVANACRSERHVEKISSLKAEIKTQKKLA